jgi:hypothetical protein
MEKSKLEKMKQSKWLIKFQNYKNQDMKSRELNRSNQANKTRKRYYHNFFENSIPVKQIVDRYQKEIDFERGCPFFFFFF